MNPDPKGRFGQHILQQARALVAAFPGMAGVFWDQNCYTGFDYAHDDGISMAGGQCVSMMEFAQMRVLAKASKFLHDNGKVIFTNGGWTAGLARWIGAGVPHLLAGRWAGKPVSINGTEIGMLPVTGQTLRWHENLAVSISGALAGKVLAVGLHPNGDIELKPVVNNKVKNCFKVRNVQAAIRTKSGEQFKTTRVSNVNCSDGSWLYSEGTCVRNGRPLPLGTLRFTRKRR